MLTKAVIMNVLNKINRLCPSWKTNNVCRILSNTIQEIKNRPMDGNCLLNRHKGKREFNTQLILFYFSIHTNQSLMMF